MTVENQKQPLPNRRDFISLGIGVFVVGALPFTGRSRNRLIRRTLPIMGTFGEVAVVHNDETYAQNAIDAALQEMQRVEGVLTRFRPESEVGRANLGAFASPQVVSAETSGVLQSSLLWADATDGAFDPCLGRAVELWDVGNRHQPPGKLDVHRFARRGLFKALELGKSQGRDVVIFHEEDMGLDLGGIGKGYGVDRAGFDLFLGNLDLLNPEVKLIVIDEIGKMELFSSRFRTLLRQILNGKKWLLASIALHGKGLIEDIKRRPDIHLVEVNRINREDLFASILE
jgi:hypothetical protein